MRSFKHSGGISLVVACMLLPAVAWAAPTKLPTAFNPDRHVYVTPGTNVPTTGLENQVGRNAVPTYIVFTTQGDEAFTADLASDQTAKLLQIWSVQKGWPKDRYLVILAVQNKLHPEIYCTNIVIGPALSRLGITSAELKGVQDDANKFVAVNPNDFALSIMQGVADLIDQHGGNPGGNGGGGGGTNGRGDAGNGKTLLIVGGIFGALIVVAIIIFVVVRRQQKEAARKATLEKLSQAAGLRGEVEGKKGQLETVGLSFQPYETRLSAVDGLVAEARQALAGDPQRAESIARDACEKLTVLLRNVNRAIELKIDKTLESEIGVARTRVSETRTQSANFSYPGQSTDNVPAAKLLLNEPGYNPDEALTQADQEHSGVGTSLALGNVDAADAHWSAGRAACRRALNVITYTLYEKQRVETQMAGVIQQCTQDDQAAASAVRVAYFAQQFVHAANLMDTLKKLIADRAQARDIVARCSQLLQRVSEHLRLNERYASPGTDDKFAGLTRQIESLDRAVNQPTGDWSTLRASAEEAESGLNEVDREITRAREAYDEALHKVQMLGRRISQSRLPNPQRARLTGPTREKLTAVLALQARLESQISRSKQDWSTIDRDANDGFHQVDDLRAMLETDADHLRQIEACRHNIEVYGSGAMYTITLDGRVYNGGIALAIHDPDFIAALSQARRHLEAAEGCWERRSFEEQRRELGEYMYPQIGTLYMVGWWSVGQMMRDSDDLAAQHYAFQILGYRDDTTWQVWRDKFVAKQRVDDAGIFWPMDVNQWKRTGAGGADLTQAPDFKGYGGSDPWTPPTPTVTPPASA